MQKNLNHEHHPTLGVVAISYNEERDLHGFLSNLLPWVDEIVIVDDGSTDKTEKIAKSGGAKVNIIISPRNPKEYFSHQRNKGINAAKSDWLLHMDIDERITGYLKTEILEAIKDSSKDGYRFRRLNFFLHRPMRGGGLQNWNLIHLAKRELFIFGGKMHETCLIDTTDDRLGQLKEKMWHLNDEDFIERIRKSNLYSQIRAEDILESNYKVKWYDLIFRPIYIILNRYLIQNAFIDGIPGLISSLNSAFSVFRSYALVWDTQNKIPREDIESKLTASICDSKLD